MQSREAAAGAVFNNFVDGRWTTSSSGSVFENRNPADHDDLIGVFQQSTPADAEQAIRAAERAYASWHLVPAPRRAEMLFRAAQLIAERKEQFARDMTREMGKVLEETRGDVQEAIDMTFFMAGEGRRLYGQTVPSELRDKFAMSVRQPMGVCAVITPWNFPMAIPSWKIIPALVCGNTVVFKPSSLTPLSAVNFVRVLEEAGIPAGVVNLVTGGGEVGTVAPAVHEPHLGTEREAAVHPLGRLALPDGEGRVLADAVRPRHGDHDPGARPKPLLEGEDACQGRRVRPLPDRAGAAEAAQRDGRTLGSPDG